MIYSYRRVSTDKQDLGLDAQQARIDAGCQSKGYTVDASYTDDGVSGGIPLGERPEGRKLLKQATSGDVIVTAKLDRLFRGVGDAAQTMDEWNRTGIILVSLAEGFDMTTAFGRAMAQMASVFAELERAMIRERTIAALAVKRANGERLGRDAPFGWDAVGKMLVKNTSEQDALARMRRWRKSGVSLRDIASRLDDEGVKTKRGKPWSFTTVAHILERSNALRAAAESCKVDTAPAPLD